MNIFFKLDDTIFFSHDRRSEKHAGENIPIFHCKEIILQERRRWRVLGIPSVVNQRWNCGLSSNGLELYTRYMRSSLPRADSLNEFLIQCLYIIVTHRTRAAGKRRC